ncbi:ATP-binding protein [Candidatus Poribacteria bacterium]
MSLTFREKELVNIGASVATGCKPCTDYHFEKVRQAGASDEEIRTAILDAMLVRDNAKEIMEIHGLKHLGMATNAEDTGYTEKTTRMKELVSVAAAFAVNCTSNLERHIAAARTVGVDEDEITSVLDSALFIKGEAAHYVSQIVELKEQNIQLQKLLKELQETQAQLVQSEKMAALGKLVAGVVHEMNTPIAGINSAADTSTRSITSILEAVGASQTSDKVKSNEHFRGLLKALQNSHSVTIAASERITNLVNSLKSFARLDEAPFQKTDIHECVENTLTLMEKELGDQVSVVRKYGDIPEIACYPGELNQVFMNLLTNAAQAIKGEGTVTIQTFTESGGVHIQVRDTGIGIPSERIQGLFEPEFTEKGTRVKTGMGLFISHNIVQKHRGQIRVESEVGKGSTFTVILPTDLRKRPEVSDIADTDEEADRCSLLDS